MAYTDATRERRASLLPKPIRHCPQRHCFLPVAESWRDVIGA